MTWHTWWTSECARSVSLLSACFVSAVTLIPCTHRMAQDVRVFVSSHPCMKWAFLLASFFLIFIFFLSFFINFKQFLLLSTSPRTSSNIVYSAIRRWCLRTNLSPTHELVRGQRDFVVLCRCALFFWGADHGIQWFIGQYCGCNVRAFASMASHREEARIMFQISTRFQRGRFVRLNGNPDGIS